MRKQLTKITLGLAILMTAGLFGGCASSNSAITPSDAGNDTASINEAASDKIQNILSGQIESEDYDSVAITQVDFIKPYNTVDKLSEDATIVVVGVVTSTSNYLHIVNDDAVPYTVFELLVTTTLKGDVEQNAVINVAEYGGTLTAEQAGLAQKFPEMTESEKAETIFLSFGDEPIKVGQQLLLFLSNEMGYQVLNIEQPYYMIVGEYHGKLIHVNNSFVQALPIGEGLSPVVIDGDLESLVLN